MSLLDKIKGAAAKGPLKVGDKLSTGAKLKEGNPEVQDVNLDNLPGKIVIVGVPGAFTPPCSSQVPGYVQKADEFAAKGVKGIYIVAVNDAFTTQAWKEKLGASSPLVHFLADDTGAFSHAVGMAFDASGLLGNHRSKRYAAVVQDGVVKHLEVEGAPPEVTVTAADNLLSKV